MATALPERLALPSVVLRRTRVEDAEAVAEAIGSSLEHLSPWMPWADERSASPEFQRRRIEEGQVGEAAGTDVTFLLVDPDPAAAVAAVLGMAGLHARIGPGALEIGYWLRADATGRGLMTAAVAALTGAALDLDGIERVEVHCDEANRPSRAIPERLGYRLDRVEDRTPQAPAESGRHMVWVAVEPP